MIEFTILELPKNRALISANDGEYDGVAGRVIHLEKAYPNLKRVTVACFTVQHIVFAKRRDILETVHDFKSLADHAVKNGYKVGYLQGSKKAKDELSELPEKNKRSLGGPEQAFRMLTLDRIEAYLAGPGIVNRAIFKEKYYQSGIQEVGVFAEFPLFPYLHVKHASVIPILEKALQSMVDDGTLDSIRKSLEQ
ncbi:MAG: amino acid ABC transporter substrate-binding protein [Proteobacteria bacterium]|nr:amino acid ABC transporter substrate-binding protein [Pseudomonadota bacterium]